MSFHKAIGQRLRTVIWLEIVCWITGLLMEIDTKSPHRAVRLESVGMAVKRRLHYRTMVCLKCHSILNIV